MAVGPEVYFLVRYIKDGMWKATMVDDTQVCWRGGKSAGEAVDAAVTSAGLRGLEIMFNACSEERVTRQAAKAIADIRKLPRQAREKILKELACPCCDAYGCPECDDE